MIINAIIEEVTAWQETKNLLISQEWKSDDEFHEELTTVLLDVHGIYVPIKKQKQYSERVINPFRNISYYNFPGDTSILYAFSKSNSQKMLLDHPALSQYIHESNIIIKREDHHYDGIYLSYLLPEHEVLFEDYDPLIINKADILPLPSNPLEWKHEDSDLRFVTFKSNLENLLLENPSLSAEIGGNYREEWRSYSIIYYNQDLDVSVYSLMSDPSIFGEFETKS
jgi:hypothetical protein